MLVQKRILICPLDWGLGHATRCIPIIRLLIASNAKVLIAGDGGVLCLLKSEFPDLEFVALRGYHISYSEGTVFSMILKMLFSIPKIIFRIIKEHNDLKKIIKEYAIDVVISDNRYGLWNRKVKSIFITHQLMVKSPFGELFLHRIIRFFIKQYDECWVPDVEGDKNLSGDLAHKYPVLANTFFIGPLSRFSTPSFQGNKYDIVALVSGPEPQREMFQKILVNQLKGAPLKSLIVCGKPLVNTKEISGNMTVVSHLSANDLEEVLNSCSLVIARSGYSSIMDFSVLNKKAILVPTPGQTEQEYLAEKLMTEKLAYSCLQEAFDLNILVQENAAFQYVKFPDFESGLKARICKLLV